MSVLCKEQPSENVLSTFSDVIHTLTGAAKLVTSYIVFVLLSPLMTNYNWRHVDRLEGSYSHSFSCSFSFSFLPASLVNDSSDYES